MSETPDWAKGAVSTLNPTAKAQAKPTVDRIASARARGIARSKDSSAEPTYGFGYPASYWQNFAGSETSSWDAAVLVSIAGILESPILKRSHFIWQTEHYNPHTGFFNLSDTPPIAISELKDAIQNRIDELGLSLAAIWGWYADVREPIGKEWWRSDLETRVAKFRVTA
jgi:hypothetical protein